MQLLSWINIIKQNPYPKNHQGRHTVLGKHKARFNEIIK